MPNGLTPDDYLNYQPEQRQAGVSYDEYGRPVAPSFNTLAEWVAYAQRVEPNNPFIREIQQNPDGWELHQGQPRRKEDWLASNLPWLAPTIVGAAAGGLALPAIFGGGGGASAAASGSAGGVLPSSSLPVSSLMGGPAAISGSGAAGFLPSSSLPVESLMGGPPNVRPRRPFGDYDYLGDKPDGSRGRGGDGDGGGMPWWMEPVIAGLTGLPALFANNGPSDEEKAQLEQLRQLQQMQTQRIQYQNPLFEAVTQLAMSRMPGGVQQPLTGSPSAPTGGSAPDETPGRRVPGFGQV